MTARDAGFGRAQSVLPGRETFETKSAGRIATDERPGLRRSLPSEANDRLANRIATGGIDDGTGNHARPGGLLGACNGTRDQENCQQHRLMRRISGWGKFQGQRKQEFIDL